MIVPPPPKGGISAPTPGLSYRQQQSREFRQWYREHHHPSVMFTSSKSPFYWPGYNYSKWRKKYPAEEHLYRTEEDRAFRRFVDTGEFPGYPKRFVYT